MQLSPLFVNTRIVTLFGAEIKKSHQFHKSVNTFVGLVEGAKSTPVWT